MSKRKRTEEEVEEEEEETKKIKNEEEKTKTFGEYLAAVVDTYEEAFDFLTDVIPSNSTDEEDNFIFDEEIEENFCNEEYTCKECKNTAKDLRYRCLSCGVEFPLCFKCQDKTVGYDETTAITFFTQCIHKPSSNMIDSSIQPVIEDLYSDDSEEEKKEENENEDDGKDNVDEKPIERESCPYLKNPWNESEQGFPALSIIEQDIMALSTLIRNKEKWYEKFRDEKIVAKWRVEAKFQNISNEQFNYVIDELEYYFSLRKNGIEMATVEGVWQADGAVDDDLKQQLLKEMEVLENVPEEEKDWHPDSDNKVLNLIHPSLYCLVNHRSKIFEISEVENEPFAAFKKMGGGKEYEMKFKRGSSFSTQFQWLPSEFDVSSEGNVKIFSYINNLHPIRFANFYSIIEKIFAKFIPLFNNVLSDYYEPRPHERIEKFTTKYV